MPKDSKSWWTCRGVECAEKFDHRVKRARHEKVCPKPKEVKSSQPTKLDNGNLQCSTCHRVYSCKASFSSHKKQCLFFVAGRNPTLIKCEVCGKEFKHQSKFNRHKDTHAKKPTFKCICDRTFLRKDKFDNHYEECARLRREIVDQTTPSSLNGLEETVCVTDVDASSGPSSSVPPQVDTYINSFESLIADILQNIQPELSVPRALEMGDSLEAELHQLIEGD